MRIIEIGEDKYEVIKELSAKDEEFVDRMTKFYRSRFSDHFLLKSTPNPTVEDHFLICRKFGEAEIEEINDNTGATER